jgi:hypothetical protein
VTAGGTRFDHGLHALDKDRSPLATNLFRHVLDGRVHEVVLRRGIALRNTLMPYAPSIAEIPDALKTLLPPGDLVDDLGDDPPTRDRLARYYGRTFTNLIFDEVLPSFPSEARHLAFGVPESSLLTNIYPWFFPRAARRAVTGDESRAYHDRLRAGIEQRVLYPNDGGFGGFAEALVASLDSRLVEVMTGVTDLRVDRRPTSHTIDSVSGCGRQFVAPHYFWAGSWSALCALVDLPYQDVATDRVMLGSFRMNRPACTAFHEILVGDPSHHINRISFPAAFREANDPLMQIEFAVPRAEAWPTDPDHWRTTWEVSARRLGLFDEAHRIEEFDFRSFHMHFNGFGAEGEPLRDADASILRPDTNIRPIVPSMANLNLNRYLPRAIEYVTAVLAEDRGMGSGRRA